MEHSQGMTFQQEEDTLIQRGGLVGRFLARVLPSPSKPLPSPHRLCCFLDIHIILTLNHLHPKTGFFPMPPLPKPFKPNRALLPSHHSKSSFQCLIPRFPHPPPFHWPLLRLKFCLYLVDLPGWHEDRLGALVDSVQ